MTPGDADLQHLYQEATTARSRRDCPSSETLARCAAGELDRPERLQVADHLAGCADCSDEYRQGIALRSWADEAAPHRRQSAAWTSQLAYAAAAIVVISVSTGVWSRIELQRARQAVTEAGGLARQFEREANESRRALEQLSQPQVNVLIADLTPGDVARGERSDVGAEEQVLSVPARAQSITLILNVVETPSASDYALEITNAGGAVVWQGRGLQKSRYNTFTLALPRTVLPEGRYRLALSAAEPGGTRLVEEYRVRLEFE